MDALVQNEDADYQKRSTEFWEEVKALTDKHGIDIAAVLKYEPTGITAQIALPNRVKPEAE